MTAQHPTVGEEIRSRKVLTDELTARLRGAVQEFTALGGR